MSTESKIGGQVTYYESTGEPTSFRYDRVFYGRLESWLSRFSLWTPWHWARPFRLWCRGEGRALDLTRIDITDPEERGLVSGFSGRWDVWRNYSGTKYITARTTYWGTVASLHYHFRNVISYLDNEEHHNHVHIDNAVSGAGDSVFATGSRAQTLYVQAVCNYIWGYPTSIDGSFGPQTRRDSSAALARIGFDGDITTQSRWLTFNKATAQMGLGSQSY